MFYVGTSSKPLHADIRGGYVVVPKRFMEVFAKAQRHTGKIVSKTLRNALSHFIGEGRYAAHIRKMARVYHARRNHLCHVLRAIGTDLTVSLPDGPTQVVAQLGRLHGDDQVCRRLAEVGVVVRPLSSHYFSETKAQGLFLGFAAWNEAEIDLGVQIIARVMSEAVTARKGWPICRLASPSTELE